MREAGEQAKSPHREIVYFCLFIILLMGFLIRFGGFYRAHSLTFDESIYIKLSSQLYQNITNYSPKPIYEEFVISKGFTEDKGFKLAYLNRPLFKHPPLFPYLILLSYHLFGHNEISEGMVSLVTGALTILLVFFIAKAIYDYRVGLLASFFLAIDPVHWICSEKIWADTTVTFFILLALLLFILGRKRNALLLLSGVSIGLAMLSKYTGILAIPVILLFTAVSEKNLWKSKYFWLSLIIPFILFSPWVIWNYIVYGDKLFEHTVIIHSNIIHLRYFLIRSLVGLGSIAAVVIFYTKLKSYKVPKSLKYKLGVISRKRNLFVAAAVCLGLPLLLVILPQLRYTFKYILDWNHVPSYGWDGGYFETERWYFYFKRLLELSPFYIFSFIFILAPFYRHKESLFLRLCSICLLSLFILWRNFQSRYILPVIPILIIISAYLQVKIYDKISSLRKPKRNVLRIIYLGLIFYFLLKTLRVDMGLAVANMAAYF